jgi:hypothetical protein
VLRTKRKLAFDLLAKGRNSHLKDMLSFGVNLGTVRQDTTAQRATSFALSASNEDVALRSGRAMTSLDGSTLQRFSLVVTRY